uniref:Uncharacterized protein n=1 Tax=Fagus sylvatica TaxID=28930 RepID=A0A2N9I4D1_FAGSY
MSTDRAEVLEVLAHGGVFFEEQLERLGALVRLCNDEECFKVVIDTEAEIDDEACSDWWSSSQGGRSTVGADLQIFLSKSTIELRW